MNEEWSVIGLIAQATVPVQVVVAVLLSASVLSWVIIFRKRLLVSRAQREAEKFEQSFRSGAKLSHLHRAIEASGNATGMSSIFESGYREFAKLGQHGSVPADQLIDGSRRAMRAVLLKEIDKLEQSLAVLATVGSTSPYVGLFGTVWGIMNAFTGIGNMQQATLHSVAPGISEALLATAIGLFAAIPSVIAFNHFADQVGRLETRYSSFTEEFSTVLQRH